MKVNSCSKNLIKILKGETGFGEWTKSGQGFREILFSFQGPCPFRLQSMLCARVHRALASASMA